MSNDIEFQPMKSIADRFTAIKWSTSDSHFQVMEIFELLELMNAGDSRVLSDRERLHRLESTIAGAARLAKHTAENIDKISEDMESIGQIIDQMNGPQMVPVSHEEAEFIENYRATKKKHKKIIRDLAMQMSNPQTNGQRETT